MSAKRDALANVSPAYTLLPQTLSGDETGTGVEVRGYEEVEIVVAAGLVSSGGVSFDVLESDDNSTFITVAAGDLDGTFADVTTSNDNALHRVGYMGSSRYIRVDANAATSPASMVGAVTVNRRRPHFTPAA